MVGVEAQERFRLEWYWKQQPTVAIACDHAMFRSFNGMFIVYHSNLNSIF